jgi:hypothetical protein
VTEWTPRDYTVLVVSGTACLCLVILVLGAVLGVINGSISVEELGEIQGAGIGGGLLGFGVIIYQIIKVTLGKEKDDE